MKKMFDGGDGVAGDAGYSAVAPKNNFGMFHDHCFLQAVGNKLFS